MWAAMRPRKNGAADRDTAVSVLFTIAVLLSVLTVVAAVPPGGVEAANLLAALRERYGVVLSGGQGDLAGKIVRFGTMGDVGENDVLGAIASIERALADVGAASSRGAGVAAAEESFAGLTAASV